MCVHVFLYVSWQSIGEFALFEYFAESLTEFIVALCLSTLDELLQLICTGTLLLLYVLLVHGLLLIHWWLRLIHGLTLIGLLISHIRPSSLRLSTSTESTGHGMTYRVANGRADRDACCSSRHLGKHSWLSGSSSSRVAHCRRWSGTGRWDVWSWRSGPSHRRRWWVTRRTHPWSSAAASSRHGAFKIRDSMQFLLTYFNITLLTT